MQQLALFAPPFEHLHVTPTAAMRTGAQRVYQCSWCGTVLVVPRSFAPTHACSNCGRDVAWWEQELPVAGLALAGEV
jgi:DNA-directed RNA polymerase subunit RPC12/RpoP